MGVRGPGPCSAAGGGLLRLCAAGRVVWNREPVAQWRKARLLTCSAAILGQPFPGS